MQRAEDTVPAQAVMSACWVLCPKSQVETELGQVAVRQGISSISYNLHHKYLKISILGEGHPMEEMYDRLRYSELGFREVPWTPV